MQRRILLVDDSKTQLSSLKILLSKNGYEVITASDGLEGINAAYEVLPDVIVSDIVMPNINGYHLCRLLKDDPQMKEIPIILLSVLSKKLDQFWGIQAGADAYIPKDSQMDSLLETIERLIENKSSSVKPDIPAVADEAPVGQDFQTKITKLLDQSLVESTIMNEFRNLSEFILDTEKFNNGLFALINSIIDFNLIGIFFNNRDNKKENLLHLSQNGCINSKEVLNLLTEDFFNTCFNVNNIGKTRSNAFSLQIKQAEASDNIEIQYIEDYKSKVVIPIEFNGSLIGGISFYHINEGKFNPSKIFNIILNELKLLMRIKWLYSETQYLSTVDGLTGLYNRRSYAQTLNREFLRAKRYGKDLTIGIFDIDNFKLINDTYGHQFGDRVISEISKIISGSLRRSDYAARYGGEEIAVILPETSIDNAVIPIERIRELIEQKIFIFENDIEVRVTISAGLAARTNDITTETQLVKLADTALYEAKHSGRNRVIVVK